ncbi:MAG: hypothetical protein ABI895_32370 [Deltaproteobacteria bacterium]
MSEANGRLEHLEQQAEEVRSKLERRVKVLDERRHHVADVARSAARQPLSIALLAAAGTAVAIFLVQRVRARRTPAERFVRLLESATPREKSVFAQSVQKAATSLAVLAVQRAGKRGLDRWLAEPARSPEPLR